MMRQLTELDGSDKVTTGYIGNDRTAVGKIMDIDLVQVPNGDRVWLICDPSGSGNLFCRGCKSELEVSCPAEIVVYRGGTPHGR